LACKSDESQLLLIIQGFISVDLNYHFFQVPSEFLLGLLLDQGLKVDLIPNDIIVLNQQFLDSVDGVFFLDFRDFVHGVLGLLFGHFAVLDLVAAEHQRFFLLQLIQSVEFLCFFYLARTLN
jgi:hypothetical protein